MFVAIYSFLFKEGVIACKKDYLPNTKHQFVETRNLFVCKAMQSLKSRNFVLEQFNWQWYYYRLTDEGITYLRDYLHLSADTVPATLKKQDRPTANPFAAPRTGGSRGGGERGEYRGPREGKIRNIIVDISSNLRYYFQAAVVKAVAFVVDAVAVDADVVLALVNNKH